MSDLPSSILIVGAGAFGLSTAFALARRPLFSKTTIILLDPHLFDPRDVPPGETYNSWSSTAPASVDTSRIVRPDYADAEYAALAKAAQKEWRKPEWRCNAQGVDVYHEPGFVLTANEGSGAYVKKSYENARMLASDGSEPVLLESEREIIDALMPRSEAEAPTPDPGRVGSTGQSGYLNPSSGWAIAELALLSLRERVRNTGRVRFVCGAARFLLLDSNGSKQRIAGVEYVPWKTPSEKQISTEHINADLTILATGAQTPTLVSLSGVATVRAQPMAYLSVNPEQSRQLENMRVHINMSTGYFIFPPLKQEIKVARHSYGWSNPVRIKRIGPDWRKANRSVNALSLDQDVFEPVEVVTSLPVSHGTASSDLDGRQDAEVPSDAAAGLYDFLHAALPLVSKQKKFWKTRICHYLDTISADFLVCYYPGYGPVKTSQPSTVNFPGYGSLFIATGGSGHAFKFLPVLGEKVVDVLDGTDLDLSLNSESRNQRATHSIAGVDDNRAKGVWTRKWSWPKSASPETVLDELGVETDIEIWCADGSRGGKPGLIWPGSGRQTQ